MEMGAEQERWIINRIGLLNFWYYDEEEFNFLDGRLLLRGSNGSGKSVTMQSFIPLLLDGNKSPERLDPFGSRARRLENYLLGEEEGSREESTGYLFMEFSKKEVGHYLTIGMGLRAKRGRNLDFWGFALTDGRRVGKDFFLYRELEEKVPLSKIELRNRIGEGGELYDTQGEYMAMVNRLLFGFESIEEYDELIKLLIQLRTPKLSKDFKPTVIYEIMNNSLQPLSDDDLRPMSEAIENMDNIKAQLEALRDSQKAADRLKTEFNKYNRYILSEKVHDFLSNQDRLAKLEQEGRSLEEEQEEKGQLYQQAEREQEQLQARQKQLEHRREELEQHDSFQAKLQLEKLEIYLKELVADESTKENSRQEKQKKQRDLEKQLGQAVEKRGQKELELEKLLREMGMLAEGLFLYEHGYFAQELRDDLTQEYNFGLYRKEIDAFRKRVEEGKKALEEEHKKSRDYDQVLEEREAVLKEKETAGRELEKAENVLVETRTEFIEHTHTWEKRNEYLKIPGERMPYVIRAINAYGETGGYEDILQEIRKEYNQLESGLQERLAEKKAAKSGLEEQLEGKKQELRVWQEQKEPEPPREEAVMANRRRLAAQGIPFVPFYMAVDFRPEVPAALRGRLEEALLDMGLLDALLIPAAQRERVKGNAGGEADAGTCADANADAAFDAALETKDRYFCAKPAFFKQDLSLFLKPVVAEGSGLSYEEIDNALKSILLNEEEECVYINEKGEYSLGVLRGKTSGEYTPRFLGAEARRQYRQANITRVEEEISALQLVLEEELRQIKELMGQKELLQQELANFPAKDDLETALQMVNSLQLEVENRCKEVERKGQLVQRVFKELKTVRERVRELTLKLEIPLKLENFAQAEAEIRSYRDLLGEVEKKQLELQTVVYSWQSMEEQREDVLLDLDDLAADLKKLSHKIEESNNQKNNYEGMLKELNYEEVRAEIEACIKGLNTLPGQIIAAARMAEGLKEKRQYLGEKRQEIQKRRVFQRDLTACYREGFLQELRLGYVRSNDDAWGEDDLQGQTELAELTELNEAAVVRIGRKVAAELKGEERSGKGRQEYGDALLEKYHHSQQYLTEYNLIVAYRFEEEAWHQQTGVAVGFSAQEFSSYTAEQAEKLQRALTVRKRLDLFAKVHGREVNFFTLVSFLELAIEENEKLLRESDRELFEDILANTIGKKIRAKIYHSEQWVKKMNRLMEAMNTSSGLSFNLVWKNKAAETEEQIDTRELVDILKADAQLLSEEQMDRLSAHFRSKIAQARKQMDETGITQSFHAIMKEILDYRQWFEFQLFYRKTGELKKELTNNAFDKFSGGEKAMAMYVPLFSSVYARYEGARKDSPRLISLDEAFAGVDENNIRDMFRLIEELQLSFIINSQILWGDYDTLPALSICELVRPNNADFVTVIRYKWNGKTRELLATEREGKVEAEQE